MANDRPLYITLGQLARIPDADFIDPGAGVAFPAGSVGAPSAYWDASPTTGFYSPAADQIGMAITGLQHWVWSTTTMTNNHASAGYSITLSAEGSTNLFIARYTNDANPAQLSTRKARGTIAAPLAVQNLDIAYNSIGTAWDGVSAFQSVANIQYRIIEPTPGPTAMGGRIVLAPTALGTTTLTETLRIEVGTGLSMYGANPVIDQNRTLIPGTSTVAALPAIVTSGLRNVSDLEGGQGTVFGGNTLWRNMQNGQVAQNTISGAGVLSKMTGYWNFSQRSILNNTMQKLSDAGLLAKLLGLWVHAVPTNQTDALLNWITPGTRNAAIVGSPTWTANQGFTGDGSTGLIDTVASLTTFGATQNNVSVGCYVRTAGTGSAKAVMGCNNVASARRMYFQTFTSGALVVRCNDQTNDNYTPGQYTGMFVMTRGGSTTYNASVNDAAATTITRTSVTQTSAIGFLGTIDATGSEFSNAQISFSFVGIALTTTDIANLRWIMVDYYLVQIGAVAADYTVATLPLASTPPKGTRVNVTDGAASPVFAAVPTGGGSLYLPVMTDSSAWHYG